MISKGAIHLTSADMSVVVGLGHDAVSILYWGAPLPELDDITSFLRIADDGASWGEVDQPEQPGMWREGARGFLGEPALRGHRGALDWSPLLTFESVTQVGGRVEASAIDAAAGLRVGTVIELHEPGLLEFSLSVTNIGEQDYTVDSLMTWLPLPDRVTETLDFTGRWLKERQPQRRPIGVGVWSREVREGRSGHDHTIVQLAMPAGTSFGSGEAWSVGLEWSGNARYSVERTPVGRTAMGAGELLLPGEVILLPGETYEAPKVAAAYSDKGLDGITHAYCSWLRARPGHPTNIRPRPLTMNVWEAVWFDHSLDRLTSLADVAAEIGVERFVLDDGWFHLRRDDRAGLGDWWVDPHVWPDGLGELIRHVTGNGMEFGLWFEPEMVNEDSQLFRAHPDWIMHVGDRRPPEQRFQHVLNIANPEAWTYLYEQLDAILSEYDISYIKWDHNRVILEPGYGGRPIIREQTLAFYRLIDALKSSHPGLEIESCASGGGRVDLGAALHCDRFWTSDSNDALERQRIQRWSGVAIPPELLGTHIGPPTSHSTGRHHTLSFRAVTALFGHAGIEWDITTTTTQERKLLHAWADYYKENRALLHSGRVVRVDGIDAAAQVHGVVSHDRSTGLYVYAQLDAPAASRPANLLLTGLDPNSEYEVRVAQPAGPAVLVQGDWPDWVEGTRALGIVLATIGLRPPRVFPESAFVIEVARVEPSAERG